MWSEGVLLVGATTNYNSYSPIQHSKLLIQFGDTAMKDTLETDFTAHDEYGKEEEGEGIRVRSTGSKKGKE